MDAGRRIVLALSGILVLVLIVYYGFFASDENLPEVVVHDPAAESEPPAGSEPGADARADADDARWSAPVEPEDEQATMIAMGQSDPVEVTPAQSAAGPSYLAAHTWRDVQPVSEEAGEGDGGKDMALPVKRDGRDASPATDLQAPRSDEGRPVETGRARDSRSGSFAAGDEPARDRSSSSTPPLQTNRPAQVRMPPAPVYAEYIVRAGDTMSSIAADWFGDERKWNLIAQANPLVDPLRLQIGQELRLPPKDAAARAAPQQNASGSGGPYTVGPGDTLSSIARRHYGEETLWHVIYEANRRAIGSNPDALKVGMKLVIPSR